MRTNINVIILSLIFIIKFNSVFGQCIWNGQIDSNWENSANWENNIIPNNSCDVHLSDSAKIKIVVLNDSSSIKSIIIDSSITFIVEESAKLKIDSSENHAILNNGRIENSGLLEIGEEFLPTGNSLLNSGVFVNMGPVCTGLLHFFGNNAIVTEGDFINDAVLVYSGTITQTINLINNGIIYSPNIHLSNIGGGTGGSFNTSTGRIWLGCEDKKWSNSQNWLFNSFPGTFEKALIPNKAIRDLHVPNDFLVEIGAVKIWPPRKLVIDSLGSLNLDGPIGTSIVAFGDLDNYGDLKIGTQIRVNNNGITNFGTFRNFGKLIVEKVEGTAIDNKDKFYNFDTLIVNTLSNIPEKGIHNKESFYNDGGYIELNNASEDLILNNENCFFENTNGGKIVLQNELGMLQSGIAINNRGSFHNNTDICSGGILISSNDSIINDGIFINDGFLIENSNGTSNISINNGIVQNLKGGQFLFDIENSNLEIQDHGKIWFGCLKENWINKYNWLGHELPSQSDQAILAKGVYNPIIESGYDIAIRKLVLSPLVELTVMNNSTLNIKE